MQFAMIAESGPLAAQARLLCASIRRFGGQHSDAPITVITPRADRRPSADMLSAIKALGADILERDITSVAPEYGTSFRVHSAAQIEQRSAADVLVFLDSDIVFLGEPELRLDAHAATARPVDVKGMCTAGSLDRCDRYWRELCSICNVDYDRIPWTTTTVDRSRVKASYNGGFVAVRPSAQIFQRTEEYFAKSVRAGLRPYAGSEHSILTGHGLVSGLGAEYWGSSQACLSL